MKKLAQTTISELEKMYPLRIFEFDIPFIIESKTPKQIHKELKQLQKQEDERKRHTDQLFGENISDKNTSDLSRTTIVKYLIQNEEFVDKRRLLLLSLYHYKELKNIIDDIHHPLRNSIVNGKSNIEKGVQESKRIAKQFLDEDRDIYICRKTNRNDNYYVEVISSEDLLDRVPPKGERKKERENIKAINMLSNKMLTAGIIIASYNQDIKSDVFKIDYLAENLTDILILKMKKRNHMTEEEFDELINNSAMNDKLNKILSSDIKESLKGLEKYIDMDKLCLNVFMSIALSIEEGNLEYTDGNLIEAENPEDFFMNLEKELPVLYSIITKKEVEIMIDGQKYTVEDAKKVMERYVDGKYMSDFTVNNMIYQLLQSGRQASVMNQNHLEYIRNYITEQRGVISPSELQDMIVSSLMRGQDVLKMYENRKITLKDMEYAQECTDLRKHLTPAYMIEKMDALYHLNDEEHAYEKETIKRYMNLYKALYLEGKSEEDLEKAGKALIEELAKTNEEDNKRTEVQEQEGLLRYGLLSERTYAILASKGIVNQDDFISMYQKDVVHLETIKQLKEEGVQFDHFDIESYIIDSYMKIRENEKSDKTELKKYIALYKVLTLNALSEEEIHEKANDLVINIGTRIESDIEAGKQIKAFGKEDRKNLYELEAIPIDTVALWADKGELIELLKSEFLVPKDLKKLYQQNSIILHDIQEIIQSQDVKLEQKIAIINIVFPSPEDANIREELFGKITELDETVVPEKESTHREVKQKHGGTKPQYHKYIFDTAVRYNSWIQSDENVKMEILNDGHIAVHLPNVKEGIVVIEQFYKLKTAKNGKKKMEDAWGVGGFVLPEEDYQANKNRYITKDYRVNRQQLGDVVKELAPKLEEKGISGNLYHFQNYPEVVQKLIGIPKGLAKAKTEQEREKAIRTLEDSEQYSAEEMEKIKKVSQAWLSVRESRRIYEK